jgi:SAM-dependent methyltransferase
MAKKIKFESFKYQFFLAAQGSIYFSNAGGGDSWHDFLNALEFENNGIEIKITWSTPKKGSVNLSLEGARFYFRGDSERYVKIQSEKGMLNTEDHVKKENNNYFKDAVGIVAKSAGYSVRMDNVIDREARIESERKFHDAWAKSEDVETIDVRESNEVCTAPEMRYIKQRLGDIRGKSLLDVGCGLGEASVYFAMLGAKVTSSDLSQGMLDATLRLARANGVSVKQHLASAEDMQLQKHEKFDIIYAGNLLHHVNIEETIMRVKPHLTTNGVFVSWDPLAYNPAINVYRALATEVRTPDEHPFRLSDIKLFKKHFTEIETQYFWLTTLLIFIIMALAQRRNPNKERFWKIILKEGKSWSWLYKPLEKLDRFLLFICPPLRLLCWNVVIICTH